MSATDDGEPEHSALIKSVGDKRKATYEITVTGDLEADETFDHHGGDLIDGRRGTGIVQGGGEDGFRYNGRVESFSANGPVKLVIDGIEHDAPSKETSQHTGGTHRSNWMDLETEDPRNGVVSKPWYTTGPMALFVSPDGSDGAGVTGSKDDPFRSIQAAMNRVPVCLNHDVTISVADGEYDTDLDGYALHSTVMLMSGSADFLLEGNREHPERVVHSGRMNWTGFGKAENMTVAGLTFTRHCQFAGVGDMRDCILRAKGQQRSLSGKSGRMFFKGCEIGHPSNEYAIRCNQMVMYHLDNCDLIASKAAIEGRNANRITVEGSCDKDAPKWFESNDDTRVFIGGAEVSS